MTLELKNISKTYKGKAGNVNVLNNISLTIDKGKFICLLGTSGCGKTTLLNIIAGFEKQSSGELFYNGKVINNVGRERVMMFQESALFPWLKVVDNIEFGMKIKGMKKAERRREALKYLDMVQLTKFQNAYIHELSGGMKQRVALARALAMNSEVLLMDEPFAALDEHTKHLLHEELLRIWTDSRKTIIFVTHDIHEAILLADTIIILSPNTGSVKRSIEIKENRSNRGQADFIDTISKEIKQELREESEKHAE